jgi:FkbM family methyltransferase
VKRLRQVFAALLILFAGLWAFSRLSPAAFLTAYYSVEQTIVDRWPNDEHRRDVEKLAPSLIRSGWLRPSRVQVEPGISLLLDPGDLVALDILRGGPWQPEVWNAIQPSLGPGHVLLDVGAHIGYFSFKGALRVGRSGRVVSFEPNPETLKLLRANVEANHVDNVTIAPVAATDRETRLKFFAAPEVNTGASSLAEDNASVSATEQPREYTVQGRPIDDVVRALKLTRVDAIKMDIEGAESSALRGAADTLRRYHPVIAVEVVGRQLRNMRTSPEELAGILRAAGYNHAVPLNPTRIDWQWSMVDPKDLMKTLNPSDPSATGQLIRGFHGVDDETADRTSDASFAVRLPRPAAAEGWVTLRFRSSVPVTISGKVSGGTLPSTSFQKSPGEQTYRERLPAGALQQDVMELEITGTSAIQVVSIGVN